MSSCAPQVMTAVGSCMTNKYSEGRPNARYYGGNEFIDQVELLCEVSPDQHAHLAVFYSCSSCSGCYSDDHHTYHESALNSNEQPSIQTNVRLADRPLPQVHENSLHERLSWLSRCAHTAHRLSVAWYVS